MYCRCSITHIFHLFPHVHTLHSPAHYVTPFTSEASQVVHQPMSIAQGSLGGLSAVVTTGYDLSQVQPVYSQQLMAAAGADRGAVLSGSNMQTIAAANRTSPQTVSAVSVGYTHVS